VLGAVIFLGEQVTLVTIAGGLLILAGVAAASIRRKPAAPGKKAPLRRTLPAWAHAVPFGRALRNPSTRWSKSAVASGS
jgi:Flp pilus assembly protein protease CpaA